DELSRTDSLTGLHVRRHWLELAGRALRRHREERVPMVLMLLDIDHFKVANDHPGHSLGDDVLRIVAATIRKTLGQAGTAGRYGGDAFGLPVQATPPHACALAASPLEASRAASPAGIAAMRGTRITASIGMAMARASHTTVEQWIDDADAALYRAKRAGRGRIGT